MDSEQIPTKPDLDWLYEIGNHIAAGDTLDEALAATVNFASALVNCHSCFIYVREGAELVLWVWRHSDHKVAGPTKLPIGQGYATLLAQHRAPIAISSNHREHFTAKLFEQWSVNPGETFVSVPLLSRDQLVGIINLQHRQPRPYSLREVSLLSSAAYLLGAEVGISSLESRNSDLLLQLETRKLVERGKSILQRDLGLSEEQAYLMLQRQSRQKRKPMREIAEAIILGEEVKFSSLTDRALAWYPLDSTPVEDS